MLYTGIGNIDILCFFPSKYFKYLINFKKLHWLHRTFSVLPGLKSYSSHTSVIVILCTITKSKFLHIIAFKYLLVSILLPTYSSSLLHKIILFFIKRVHVELRYGWWFCSTYHIQLKWPGEQEPIHFKSGIGFLVLHLIFIVTI